MRLLSRLFLFSLALTGTHTSSYSSTLTANGTVTLDAGLFVGANTGNVTRFRGIPFAIATRYELPLKIKPYTGTYNATLYGSSCPQLVYAGGDSEDCLLLNVVLPTRTKHTKKKLPVEVWIHGGAFEAGSSWLDNPDTFVQRSKFLGDGVIHVSMNYRQGGFGFMPGKEIRDAGVGNIGLHDQREALRWVQKYISAFGGDNKRVTLGGASAGAMSTMLQMVANGGNSEGLFHAAVTLSGSPMPVDDMIRGQGTYNTVVAASGCSGAADTLVCLKGVSYEVLKAAIDTTPNYSAYKSIMLTYLPRVDGVFLKDHPQKLVNAGKFAKLPILTGGCDDEGTLFSPSTNNITTNAEFLDYFKTLWFPKAPSAFVENLVSLYPEDPSFGSPFDTGEENTVTPQSKRMAALQGDAFFQAPQYALIEERSGVQPIWAYLSKRFKSQPLLGSMSSHQLPATNSYLILHSNKSHGSDVTNILYGPGSDLQDYIVQFVSSTGKSPNGRHSPFHWPKYEAGKRKLLVLYDEGIKGKNSRELEKYPRKEQMEYLRDMSLKYPF